VTDSKGSPVEDLTTRSDVGERVEDRFIDVAGDRGAHLIARELAAWPDHHAPSDSDRPIADERGSDCPEDDSGERDDPPTPTESPYIVIELHRVLRPA